MFHELISAGANRKSRKIPVLFDAFFRNYVVLVHSVLKQNVYILRVEFNGKIIHYFNLINGVH